MVPFNQAVKFGFILGLILLAYTVVLYAVDANLFSISFSIINGLFTFGLMIIIAIMAINKTRDVELAGKITYVQALLIGVGVLVISGYLNNFFAYILNGYVDTEYMLRQSDNMITSLEGKVPDESLDQMVDKFKENLDPVKNLVKSLWITPIMALVISAIIAAFIKKDKTVLG